MRGTDPSGADPGVRVEHAVHRQGQSQPMELPVSALLHTGVNSFSQQCRTVVYYCFCSQPMMSVDTNGYM